MTAMPCGIIISQNFKIILIMVEAESLESTGHKEKQYLILFLRLPLSDPHLARMYGFDIHRQFSK
jgi:hypothetical protein